MLTCLFVRRRLGAHVDGALDGDVAASTARHVATCARCQQRTEELRRLRALLARSLGPAVVPEPDWTGFWPGIVRGVEDARLGRPQPLTVSRQWRPKWAISGALAAFLFATATLWQLGSLQIYAEPAVIVSSADTEYPEGTVMVYSPQGQNLAVVWVFGLEE